MQPLNYYQLFQELLSHYQNEEIIIEISTFNQFVEKIKSRNIICNFDYYDLEEYAHSLPGARIEYSKLIFYPSITWIKDVKLSAGYYKTPQNHVSIIEIWKEINK
jgi:hypothetical protein